MRAELRTGIPRVRVELGVDPRPLELAPTRGPLAQARICLEDDAAIDTDDGEGRIGWVPVAALRIRDVVADGRRRRLGPLVLAILALDARSGGAGERRQQRDRQEWGDQQARAEGQLGSGEMGHGEAERVTSEP